MGSATGTALPTALTWSDEDAGHTVQLEFGNVLLWRHAVSSGGRAGILLGNSRRGSSGKLTAYIQSSETLFDNNVDVIEALHKVSAAAASRDQSHVAGIWISDPEESLPADSLTLPELRDGTLLLALHRSSAQVHFWDAKARELRDLGLTFPVKPRDLTLADYEPFRPMFLGGSTAQTSEVSAPARLMPPVNGAGSITAATTAAPALEPPISQQPAPKTNRFPLNRANRSTAMAAAATVGFVIVATLLWPRSKPVPQTAAASDRVASQQLVSPAAAPELGLELNRAGSDLQLRWNKHLPLLASARGGSVAIADGTDHLVLALNRDQLTTGRVIYTPRSRDVDFELTIQSGDGKNLTESVRVVQPPPKPASSPVPRETAIRARAAEPVATPAPVSPKLMTPPPARQTAAIRTVQFPDEPPPTIAAATVPVPQSLTNLRVATPAFPTTSTPRPTPVSPAFTTPVRLPQQIWSTLRKETEVQLTLVIGPNGRVQSVKRPTEQDPVRRAILATAASTVVDWRFIPAMINGTAVKGEYVVTFRFKPNGSPAATR